MRISENSHDNFNIDKRIRAAEHILDIGLKTVIQKQRLC